MSNLVELVLDAKASLAEGPIWDPGGWLWWVNIQAREVHRFDPAAAADSSFDVGEDVGAVMSRRSGGLLLATATGLMTCDVNGADRELVHRVDTDPPGGRFNDAKADRWGRVWAGTMLSGTSGAGALYRLDHDGSLHMMLSEVSVSNGLDWNPDGSLMYYIDTPTLTVDVFDHDPQTGELTNRRPFATAHEAGPDGLTVDAEGGVWVAMSGGWRVERFDPDGQLDWTLQVPARRVTSCCFGGDNMSTLFITTARDQRPGYDLTGQPHAGGIFAADVGVRGQAPGQWWG